MYSEALLKMDRNNTIYTLTEYYKEQLEQQAAEIADRDNEISEQAAEIARLRKLLAEK